MKYLKLFENIKPIDIGSFDEDDWDDDETPDNSIEYYMGKLSYDHIEIFRVLLENNEVIRYGDNKKIRSFNDQYSPIKKNVDERGIYIDIPHFTRHGLLVYFYSNKSVIRDVTDELRDQILYNSGSEEKNRLWKIIDNNEMFYFGEGGSIVNLI